MVLTVVSAPTSSKSVSGSFPVCRSSRSRPVNEHKPVFPGRIDNLRNAIIPVRSFGSGGRTGKQQQGTQFIIVRGVRFSHIPTGVATCRAPRIVC